MRADDAIRANATARMMKSADSETAAQKTAAVETLAAAGQTKGARTMNETQDLVIRIPRPRPFVEPVIILPPIRILPPTPRPPDPKLVPVVVSEVSATVRIRGEIASTVFEAVVHNPNSIALEGEFTLPLPAGATVTGAALDINGKMIDASIVEKKRAQEVFEAIERKGADPALVESVGGNSYRTRVERRGEQVPRGLVLCRHQRAAHARGGVAAERRRGAGEQVLRGAARARGSGRTLGGGR